jgi:DNA-binding NtrC family response regulator
VTRDFDTTVKTASRTGGPELLVRRLAALRVVAGADRGREIQVGSTALVLGSGAQCDLVLADRRVSARHAEIALRSGGYVLRDLGSKNGVRVGPWRVDCIYLAPGMQFTLGGTTLEVLDLAQVEETELSGAQRFGAAVGKSTAMRALFARLAPLANADTNLLFDGETGTGKSFLAEQVHLASPRAEGPFEVFDCGAVNPSLIESHLFGHARGAFTGAESDRAGMLQICDGGTLFLDEIGTLPLELQPKLLRVIETKHFCRVGESRRRRADIRIISATNLKLEREIDARRFRQDLYYRLAVVRLTVPPLRDRREDLPLLLEALAAPWLSERESLMDTLTGLLPLLGNHDWPGNVRELRNVVERLAQLPVEQALPTAIRPAGGGDLLQYAEARGRALDHFERRYVSDILRVTGGNVTSAAQAAGVSRRHITALMTKHRISRGD